MFKANRTGLIVTSLITCLTIQQSRAAEIETPNGPNAKPLGTVSGQRNGSESSGSVGSNSTSSSVSSSSSSFSETSSVNTSESGGAEAEGDVNLVKKASNKSDKNSRSSGDFKVASKKSTVKKQAKKSAIAKAKSSLKAKRMAKKTKLVSKSKLARKKYSKSNKAVAVNQNSVMEKASMDSAATLGLLATANAANNASTSNNSASSMNAVNSTTTKNVVNTTNIVNTKNISTVSDVKTSDAKKVSSNESALDSEMRELELVPMQGGMTTENNSTRMTVNDTAVVEKSADEAVPEMAYLVPKRKELLVSIGGSGLKTDLTGSDSTSSLKNSSTKFQSTNSIAYGFGQGTYIAATGSYVSDDGSLDRGSGFAGNKHTASGFSDPSLMVGHKVIGSNMALIMDAAVFFSTENDKQTKDINNNVDENAMSGRTSLRPEVIAYMYNQNVLGGASMAYSFKQDGKSTTKNFTGISTDTKITGGNVFETTGFIEQRANLAFGGALSYLYTEEQTNNQNGFKSTIAKSDLIMGTGYLKYQAMKELQLQAGLSYGRQLSLGGLSIDDTNIFGLSLGGKLIF